MREKQLYEARFEADVRPARQRLWKVLCQDWFSRYVRPSDTVVDLGAGFCEFINAVEAAHKIAVDIRPDLSRWAEPGVRTVARLSELEDASADVVFASNFFEHLESKESMLAVLEEVLRVLRPGGQVLVLQPNIRATRGEYWDFFDHHLPLTEKSTQEALELAGFEVTECRARFLPYTTKSRLPSHPLLVRAYLRVPLAHRFLGGQAWLVGRRP